MQLPSTVSSVPTGASFGRDYVTGKETCRCSQAILGNSRGSMPIRAS